MVSNSLCVSGFTSSLVCLCVCVCVCVLQGSVVVSLLFWGFANEISTVDEAKKYVLPAS